MTLPLKPHEPCPGCEGSGQVCETCGDPPPTSLELAEGFVAIDSLHAGCSNVLSAYLERNEALTSELAEAIASLASVRLELETLRALLPNTTAVAAERDGLRSELEAAKRALDEIASYEIDWTKGTAENVGALQAIAERTP